MNKLILSLMVACSVLTAGRAQQVHYLEDPNYGATAEEREENMRAYQMIRNDKLYERFDGLGGKIWALLDRAPRIHPNIYQYAIEYYEMRIEENAGNPELQTKYEDSLVYALNRRVDAFSDTPFASRFKQARLETYRVMRPNDHLGIMQFAREYIENPATEATARDYLVYISSLKDLIGTSGVDSTKFLSEISRIDPIIRKLGSDTEVKAFEALFRGSGLANCEAIEAMYRTLVNDNPTDVTLLARVLATLEGAGCSGEFFIDVARKYYALSPTYNGAIALARAYRNEGNVAEARRHYNAALELATEPQEKFNVLSIVANMELSNNPRGAAGYARQMIGILPDDPGGHFLLAAATAEGSAGCADFERSTVYWLAYDLMAAARSRAAAAGRSDVAQAAENLMAGYRRAWPSKDELFYRGHLTQGAAYRVECGWVSGNTTVRWVD